MVFSNDQSNVNPGDFSRFRPENVSPKLLHHVALSEKRVPLNPLDRDRLLKLPWLGLPHFRTPKRPKRIQIRSKIIVLIGFNPIRIAIFIYMSIKLLIFPWNHHQIVVFWPLFHHQHTVRPGEIATTPATTQSPKISRRRSSTLLPGEACRWRTGFPVLEISTKPPI